MFFLLSLFFDGPNLGLQDYDDLFENKHLLVRYFWGDFGILISNLISLLTFSSLTEKKKNVFNIFLDPVYF